MRFFLFILLALALGGPVRAAESPTPNPAANPDSTATNSDDANKQRLEKFRDALGPEVVGDKTEILPTHDDRFDGYIVATNGQDAYLLGLNGEIQKTFLQDGKPCYE